MTLPPRAARWLPALALVLAVGLLHHEVLLGGAVYHMDDAADGYHPAHLAAWRALGAGELPTWERGTWTGYPLAAVPYYGVFYPPNLLLPLIGMARGLGVSVALHAAGAGLAMFLLLRRRGLGQPAALLGALSLALSSFLVERIRHVIFVQVLLWVPLGLAAFEGWLQHRRRSDLVLLAASVALGTLCGALPLLPYFALFAVVWVPARAAQGGRAVLGPLAAAGGAAAIGVLLAGIQLALTLAHLPLSPRSLGTDPSFAATYAWPDLAHLWLLLAPDVLGSTSRSGWLGTYNHWEIAGYYSGALGLLLAPLAWRCRGRPELRAGLGLVLVAVLLALGEAGPLHRLFFRFVPLYDSLRCPARALVLTVLLLPILAAHGLDELLRRPPRITRPGRLVGAALALGICAVVAAIVLGAHPPGEVALQRARTDALAHLALVVGAAGLVLGLWLGGRLGAGPAGWLVVLVATLDLLGVARRQVQPRPADYVDGSARFAVVDWLEGRPPGDRVVVAPDVPFRLLNLGLWSKLESVGGYDSFAIWRTVHAFIINNYGHRYPHERLRHDFAAGQIYRPDGPLLDFLGARWLIATAAPSPRWVERYHLPDGEPVHATHEAGWDRRLRVFENAGAMPRAFVVYRAVVQTGPETALAEALARLDAHDTVLLERAPVPTPAGQGPAFTPARLLEAGRHHLTIEATALRDGVLVVSEAHYPGWSATVDGQLAPLLRANFAFRAVALRAGTHRVELRFTSRPASVGLGLSAAGALGLVLLGLWARRGRRAANGGRTSGSDAPPSDAPPSDAPPADALPSDALPSDALPSDSPPSDAPPSDSPGGPRAIADGRPRVGRRWWWLLAVVGLLGVAPLFAQPTAFSSRYDWRYVHSVAEAGRRAVLGFAEAPLWNPYMCGGEVLLANPQSDVASPTFLWTLLFGTALGAKLAVATYIALALAGAFALARDMDMPPAGAALAAALFGCNGWLALRLAAGHAAFAGGALLPLLVLAYRRAGREPIHLLGLGAVAVWILAQGGTATAGLAAVLLALVAAADAVSRRSLRPFGLLAAGAGVALILGAVRILPALEFALDHPRRTVESDATAVWNLFNLGFAWGGVVPVPGKPYYLHEYSFRIALVALPLVLHAAWRELRRGARREGALYLIAAVGVAIAVGDAWPYGPWWLLRRLPLFEDLRVPSRYGLLVALALALLAGRGLALLEARPGIGAAAPAGARRWLVPAVLLLGLGESTLFLATRLSGVFDAPLPSASLQAPFFHTAGDWRHMLDGVVAGHGVVACDEEAPLQRAASLDVGDVAQVRVEPAAAGAVALRDWSPGRRTVVAELAAPATLVFNDNWNEHFRASAGNVQPWGEHHPRDRAGGRLAVALPAGHHELTVRFAPRSFTIGAAVSATGAAGALLLLWRRRRARRSPR